MRARRTQRWSRGSGDKTSLNKNRIWELKNGVLQCLKRRWPKLKIIIIFCFFLVRGVCIAGIPNKNEERRE